MRIIFSVVIAYLLSCRLSRHLALKAAGEPRAVPRPRHPAGRRTCAFADLAGYLDFAAFTFTVTVTVFAAAFVLAVSAALTFTLSL